MDDMMNGLADKLLGNDVAIVAIIALVLLFGQRNKAQKP